MEIKRGELSRIQELLRSNPRGMNVNEIARSIKMHRQSAAKYLEMLTISGHVDVKSHGSSKVYYLSQRLQISSIISLFSDLIIILDKDCKILNVNNKFLDFINAREEDILYKNFNVISSFCTFDFPIMTNIRNAVNGQQSLIDTSLLYNDIEKFFNIKFIPAVFDYGQQGVIILFEDITDKMRIELTIKESELKFRRIIEESSDGIIITDDRGIITEYNRRIEQITGIMRDEALGTYVWEMNLYNSFDERKNKAFRKYNILYKYYNNFKMNSKIKYYEMELIRPDKIRRTVQITFSPIQIEKGYIILIIVRDITKQKIVEETLQDNENNLRMLVDTTSAGMMIYRDDDVMYVNKAFEHITGYTKNELLGSHLINSVCPGFDKVLQRKYDSANDDDEGRSLHLDKKIITKSGAVKWVKLSICNVLYKEVPVILVTCIDITEYKKRKNILKMRASTTY